MNIFCLVVVAAAGERHQAPPLRDRPHGGHRHSDPHQQGRRNLRRASAHLRDDHVERWHVRSVWESFRISFLWPKIWWGEVLQNVLLLYIAFGNQDITGSCVRKINLWRLLFDFWPEPCCTKWSQHYNCHKSWLKCGSYACLHIMIYLCNKTLNVAKFDYSIYVRILSSVSTAPATGRTWQKYAEAAPPPV